MNTFEFPEYERIIFCTADVVTASPDCGTQGQTQDLCEFPEDD